MKYRQVLFEQELSTKQRLCYCLLSTIALVSYVCLGSMMFTAIEAPYQRVHKTPKINDTQTILDNLEGLLNISQELDYVDQEYLSLLNKTTELANHMLLEEESELLPWNIFTGIHFCMTAVTTIGYGYITPMTQLGRGLCIPYIIIGIPLNIFLSANLGFLLVQAVSRFYSLIAQYIFCGENSPEIPDVHISDGDIIEDQEQTGAAEPAEVRQRVAMRLTNIAMRYNDGYTSDEETERAANRRHKTADKRETPSVSNHGVQNTKEREIKHVDVTKEEKLLKANRAKNSKREARRGIPRPTKQAHKVPLWFLFLLLTLFCLIVAYILFAPDKSKTYIDCLYFVIVTFTTVGFGDLEYTVTRGKNLDDTAIWAVLIYTYGLMELGLIIMAATITVWAERWKENVRDAKRAFKRNRIVRNIAAKFHSGTLPCPLPRYG